MSRGSVALVGAGPGDPGLLTLKAKHAIETADVLVYDYLAAAPIVALAPPSCERLYVGKKAKQHTLTQPEITALIVRLGREGKRVVRLKGGDPFVFGRGGEEAQELRAAGIAFEIIPGITSGIAAPAYAGIPVTHRDHNTAFTLATGHEDPTKGTSTLDWSKLADPHQTLVLYMAMGNLAGIVSALISNGREPSTPVAIVREGTKPQQETLVATLATIVAEVERTRFAAPAIVIVGGVVTLREEIAWFDTSPLFGKTVLVTRPAGQDADFAARLWELGAEPVLAPMLSIAPPDDPAEASAAVAGVRTYRWVVFSSRNGVAAFFAELTRGARDARALGDVCVAAIGPKTADALLQHGVVADYVPQEYVSEAVAAGLLERTAPGDRVLLFRAQEARDVLPDTLRASGRVVDVAGAYRALDARDADLREKVERCDVLTFTSAGTVRSFVAQIGDIVPATNGKLVACIGPVTAAAAREAGMHVHIVAVDYTVDGLIEAMLATAAAG